MKLAGLLVLAAAAGAMAPAGCGVDQRYSQTELATLQTREFAAGTDATFDAAMNALFDAGYVVRQSDRRGGFVAGTRSTASGLSFSYSDVQLKIEAAGAGRSSVRISTTDGSQQKVNTKTIDEINTLIERRLLGGPTPPTPTSSLKNAPPSSPARNGATR